MHSPSIASAASASCRWTANSDLGNHSLAACSDGPAASNIEGVGPEPPLLQTQWCTDGNPDIEDGTPNFFEVMLHTAHGGCLGDQVYATQGGELPSESRPRPLPVDLSEALAWQPRSRSSLR